MQISVQIGLDWNWPTGTELGNKLKNWMTYNRIQIDFTSNNFLKLGCNNISMSAVTCHDLPPILIEQLLKFKMILRDGCLVHSRTCMLKTLLQTLLDIPICSPMVVILDFGPWQHLRRFSIAIGK